MRMTRFATALLAVVIATIVGLTATTDARAAAPVAEKTLPRHTVANLRTFESARDGIFYTKGNVTSQPGIRVWLQAHKNGGRPGYQGVTSVPSSATTGAFSIRFVGRCNTTYRIVLKPTVRYTYLVRQLGTVTCS